MRLLVQGGAALAGEARLPADKSMVHRALILASMAEGESSFVASSVGNDNIATATMLSRLGIGVERSGNRWRIEGAGLGGLRAAEGPLDCGNSGTTMRLGAGLLAGAGLDAELIGDASLSRRPMGRVCNPLRALGAMINGRRDGSRELAPLRIAPASLQAGRIELPMASAQVKSALLLAALGAGVSVEVTEPRLSRDHTERMLQAMGCSLAAHGEVHGTTVVLPAAAELRVFEMEVPGDFSSAAFLLAAATLVQDSKLRICDVGLNPTRTGLLEILEELGAGVTVEDWREPFGEPRGDLVVSASPLTARRPGGGPLRVGGEVVPRIIDELVVLAALLTQADGRSEVREATELRVKESDRIGESAALLGHFGAKVHQFGDGWGIEGPCKLRAARVDVASDHRIALTALVLALAAEGESELHGFEVADVSFPGVVATLEQAGAKLRLHDS